MNGLGAEPHTMPHDDRPSTLGRVEPLLVEQGVVGEESRLGDEAKRVGGSGGGDKPPIEQVELASARLKAHTAVEGRARLW